MTRAPVPATSLAKLGRALADDRERPIGRGTNHRQRDELGGRQRRGADGDLNDGAPSAAAHPAPAAGRHARVERRAVAPGEHVLVAARLTQEQSPVEEPRETLQASREPLRRDHEAEAASTAHDAGHEVDQLVARVGVHAGQEQVEVVEQDERGVGVPDRMQ